MSDKIIKFPLPTGAESTPDKSREIIRHSISAILDQIAPRLDIDRRQLERFGDVYAEMLSEILLDEVPIGMQVPGSFTTDQQSAMSDSFKKAVQDLRIRYAGAAHLRIYDLVQSVWGMPKK